MPPPNILIVAVDGLRASALGAYGNTSFATAACDHFAAESFVLDWCYAPGAELAEVYRALWQSRHPLRPASEADHAASLPEMFSAAGYRTMLVTDAPELMALAETEQFDELANAALISDPHGAEARADDLSETAMARLFAVACDAVASGSEYSRRLLWVHSRGMHGPWDAPLELQQPLLDEGDPPPIEAVAPPDITLAANQDADAIFCYSSAYASQVMALDVYWKGLMDAIAHRTNEQWLVGLLGARGYPLGEHRRIGGVETKLYGEQLHVPALLRFPSGLGRLGRSGALTSQLDILPTLLDYIELQSPEKCDGLSCLPLSGSSGFAWRDSLFAAGKTGSRAIRTASWCLRQDMQPALSLANQLSADVQSELFVRPDDRWEANDVAKLCPEVVESLNQASEDISRRIAQNEPIPMSALPSESPTCRT